MNFFARIGRVTLGFFVQTGRLMVFTGEALAACVRPPFYGRLILSQMLRIGYFSLPVVGLTAFFTGGVLALQIYLGGSRYGAESVVPQIVVLGITRELGPVIAGLMVAGQVAAAIAAEIGTMRVTEQIDALTTLATDPIRYLVKAASYRGGGFSADPGRHRRFDRHSGWLCRGDYDARALRVRSISRTPSISRPTRTSISGLIKAAVFGFIIALMGCYNGFNSKGGAQGVGTATTQRGGLGLRS